MHNFAKWSLWLLIVVVFCHQSFIHGQKIEQYRKLWFNSAATLQKYSNLLEHTATPFVHFVSASSDSKIIVACNPTLPSSSDLVNWEWNLSNNDTILELPWLRTEIESNNIILSIDGSKLQDIMIEQNSHPNDYMQIELHFQGKVTYMRSVFSPTREEQTEQGFGPTNFQVISEDETPLEVKYLDSTESDSFENGIPDADFPFDDNFLDPLMKNSLFGLMEGEKANERERRPAALRTGISINEEQFADVRLLLYVVPDIQGRIEPSTDFTTIFNPRTERWLLTNNDPKIRSSIFQPNDDVIMVCKEKDCNFCYNNRNVKLDVDEFGCIVPTGSWLNFQSGKWRITDSVIMNGYLQIDQYVILEFDGGPGSIYIIDSWDETSNANPSSVVNHGTIRVKSGRLIMKNEMNGIGNLEVETDAILEFSAQDRSQWIIFNRTEIVNISTSGIQWTVAEKPDATDDMYRPILISSGAVYFTAGKYIFHSCIRTADKGSKSEFYISDVSILQLDDCEAPIELSEVLNTTIVEKDVRQGYQFSSTVVDNDGQIDILQSTLHISPLIFRSQGLINVSRGGELRLTLTDRDENEINGLALDKNMITAYVEIFETSPSQELAMERAISANEIPNGGISLINNGLVELRTGRMRVKGGILNMDSAHLFLRHHTQVIVDQTLQEYAHTAQSNEFTLPPSSSLLRLLGMEVHSQGILNIERGWLEIASPFYQINGAQLISSGNSSIVLMPPKSTVENNAPMYTFTPCSRGSNCYALQAEGTGEFVIEASTTIVFEASARGLVQSWINRGMTQLDYGAVITVGQIIQDSAESLLKLMGRAGIYAPLTTESSSQIDSSSENQRCEFKAGQLEGSGGIQCTHVVFDRCSIRPYVVDPKTTIRPETPEPLPSAIDLALASWDNSPILALGGHVTFSTTTVLSIDVGLQNMSTAIAVGGRFLLDGVLQLSGEFPLIPVQTTDGNTTESQVEYRPLILFISEGGISKRFGRVDRSQLIAPEGFILKLLQGSKQWSLIPVPNRSIKSAMNIASTQSLPLQWYWLPALLLLYNYLFSQLPL